MGSTLARALHGAGYEITALVDKRATTARDLAKELALERCVASFQQIGKETQLLIVAVPDSLISDVDHSIAKILPQTTLLACAHTSGALPGSVLQETAAVGIPVGSLHPLQTFPSKGKSPSLRGIYFAVEGDPPALELLDDLVVKLGGMPIHVPSDGKAVYHAAAAFASNFLPGILRSSLDLLDSIGIPPAQGRKMLAPLMRQSLENCLQLGEVEALTGPVARGDAVTVQRHLEAIGEVSPAVASLYRILSLKTLELADEKGLSDEQFTAVHGALNR